MVNSKIDKKFLEIITTMSKIENVSHEMFDWNSPSLLTKFFANSKTKNIAWQMCATGIRQAVEKGLKVERVQHGRDEYDEYYEELKDVSIEFYGIIWPQEQDRLDAKI